MNNSLVKPYIRRSVWENDGGWVDQSGQPSHLFWYAQAVAEMRKRPLDDHKSWGFFGAIHGINMDEYDDEGKPQLTWHQLIDFPEFKNIDIKRLIEINDADKQKSPQGNGFWNQCQHATWYFLPWHRGYLLALESILREHVIALGGPEDWALPYWDYNNKEHWVGNSIKIPPAFTEKTLNEKPNPLYLEQRYPSASDPTYVDLDEIKSKLPTFDLNEETVESLHKSEFTSKIENDIVKELGFGGMKTNFTHDGKSSGTGAVEQYPHNIMHVLIGGVGRLGLMNDPNFAALDPIFYVHHANIDRLWSVWNKQNHTNPTEDTWLSPDLDSPFILPNIDDTSWKFLPQDVANEAQLNYQYTSAYTYTDAFGTEISHVLASNKLILRMKKFGAEHFTQEQTDIELIGATKNRITIDGSTPVSILIDSKNPQFKDGFKSFAQVIQNKVKNLITPNKFYLFVEGIKGNQEGVLLSIKTADAQHLKSVALFGLINASKSNGEHNGLGINLSIDITDYVDDLYLNNQIHELNDLKIYVEPIGLRPESTLSIEKISIHQDS